MLAARRLPLFIGATTALLLLALGSLPQDAAQAQSGPATIPDRMASYSYLTANVSNAPPGRAVALFQHDFGVEFLDFPQAVVVGADGDVYRRLDEAEDRAGPETQGDPAAMLLSPHGTHVAVGDHDTDRPDLAVVDLSTGRTTVYPLPTGHSVVPLAWSPDGSKIAYQAAAEPTNPYGGLPMTGDVGLLSTETGKAEELPGATDVWSAAFSPDGTELAIQHSAHTGGTLQVVSLVGRTPRIIQAPGNYLDGPAAWSPDDGRYLAVVEGDSCRYPELTGPHLCSAGSTEVSFVDATGQDRHVPDPVRIDAVGTHRVLGWTAPNEVAVLTYKLTEGDPDPGTYWVKAMPLGGGDPRRLSAVPGDSNYGVGRFQLATALLPDLRVHAAADADRGPWPVPLWIAAALLAGIAVAAVAGVAGNRRRTEHPAFSHIAASTG